MEAKQKPSKPLGRKSYGSIPHLPGSRTGPSDWHLHPVQAAIATVRTRGPQDRVIVLEKLDGSNVGVARIADDIVPLIRAGYRAEDSPYDMHHAFARWVAARRDRFRAMLDDRERVAGEWLLQAHGTRYEITAEDELFVGFDILEGSTRRLWDETAARLGAGRFRSAHLLSDGPALSVAAALDRLGPRGFHGACDPVEGAVWRVERDGEVEFMAKFVRADKQDGCFLPDVTGKPAVMNWPHPIV